MNLPDKKFNIGDVVNVKSYRSVSYLVEGYILLYNDGSIPDFNKLKQIDEKDLHKLEDKEIYIHRWGVDVTHLGGGERTIFSEFNFELSIEETRNYKIDKLLNINI